MTTLETQKEQLPKVEEIKTQEDAKNAIELAQNKITELGAKQLESSNDAEKKQLEEIIKKHKQMIEEYEQKLQALANTTKAKVAEEKKKVEQQAQSKQTETKTLNASAETQELEKELQAEFEKISQKSFMEGLKFLQDFAKFEVKEGEYSWLDKEEIEYFKSQLPTIKAIAGSILVGSIFENFNVSIFEKSNIHPQFKSIGQYHGEFIFTKKDGKAENLNVVEIQSQINALLKNDPKFKELFVSGMLMSGNNFVNFARDNENNPGNITPENFEKTLKDQKNLSEGEKLLLQHPTLLENVNMAELHNSPKVIKKMEVLITQHPKVVEEAVKIVVNPNTQPTTHYRPTEVRNGEFHSGGTTFWEVAKDHGKYLQDRISADIDHNDSLLSGITKGTTNALGLAVDGISSMSISNLTPKEALGLAIVGIPALWISIKKLGFFKTLLGVGALGAVNSAYKWYRQADDNNRLKALDKQQEERAKNTPLFGKDGKPTDNPQEKLVIINNIEEHFNKYKFTEIAEYLKTGKGKIAEEINKIPNPVERESVKKNLANTYETHLKELKKAYYGTEFGKKYSADFETKILPQMNFEASKTIQAIKEGGPEANKALKEILIARRQYLETINPRTQAINNDIEKINQMIEDIKNGEFGENKGVDWLLENLTAQVVIGGVVLPVAAILTTAIVKGVGLKAASGIVAKGTWNMAKGLGNKVTGGIGVAERGYKKAKDTLSDPNSIKNLEKQNKEIQRQQELHSKKETLEKTLPQEINNLENKIKYLEEQRAKINPDNTKITQLSQEKAKNLEKINTEIIEATKELNTKKEKLQKLNKEIKKEQSFPENRADTTRRKIENIQQRFEDTLDMLIHEGKISQQNKLDIIKNTNIFEEAQNGKISPEGFTTRLEEAFKGFAEQNNQEPFKIYSADEIATYKGNVSKALLDTGVIEITLNGKMNALKTQIDFEKIKNMTPELQNLSGNFNDIIKFLSKTIN